MTLSVFNPGIRLIVILWLAVSGMAGFLAARDYSVVDIVGDSVSDGVNPDCYVLAEKYGWVHMLHGLQGTSNSPPARTITNLWPGITRFNSAVSGSKAAQWADTNSYSNLGDVMAHCPDLVFVMIGGNDFLAYISDGEITVGELAEYRTNLTTIIEILQSQSPAPEIVMIGYYDLFDGLSTNPLVPSIYQGMSSYVQVANALIRDVAEAHGCFHVGIYEGFLHHGYGAELGDTNRLSPDFVRTPLASIDIHPVTAGHLWIYEQAYAKLQELKDIPRLVGLSVESDKTMIQWSSGIGQQYVVERSTNLLQADGFRGLDTNGSTPPLNTYTDPAPAVAEHVFYRIRVE